MSLFYVDTSVMASLLFDEPGSKEFRKMLKTGRAMSSYLLEAELFSTAKREKISFDLVRKFVDPLFLFTPSRPLAPEYEIVLNVDFCRGADAYHLACALFLAPDPKELSFITTDKKQGAIAKSLGFRT